MNVIVTGIRTRLAQAILALEQTREHRIGSAARDPAEAEWAAARYPEAAIMKAWEPLDGFFLTPEPVIVFCCAMGLIHPVLPDMEQDAEVAKRDLKKMEALLNRCEHRPVHLIFVSSVIALMPGKRHFYYQGWKCILESALESLVSGFPRVKLTVLYPGRLVEGGSFLHTRYQGMASKMWQIGVSLKAVRRIIGVDARLWILAKGPYSWLRDLIGYPA